MIKRITTQYCYRTLLVLALCACFMLLKSQFIYAATYYMPDNYSNLRAAMAAMSGGDTLIIRDGTYTGDTNIIDTAHTPPTGSVGAYTTIRAENPGSVIIDGEGARIPFFYMPGSRSSKYWHFDGIIFKNSSEHCVRLTKSDYVKFTRCGFVDAGDSYDGLSTHTCGYLLAEDCYSWGNARYHFHFYATDHSIMRRCVVRHDRGAYTFQVGFQVYASQYIEVQNCIVVDSDQTVHYGSPEQLFAFKVPQDSSGDINFTGCIALNNNLDGVLIQAGTSRWSNSVIWDTDSKAGVSIRSSSAVALGHLTIGNIGTYGTTGDGVSKNITNSIFYNCDSVGLRNSSGSTTSDYNALYANTADFSGVNDGTHDHCTANSNAIDPIDGSPGNGITSLKYLVRIESGSNLKGAASDGGDIGATILKRIGVSGTLWGNAGYNTTTSDNLWPWPYESNIRSKMAAYTGGGVNGARGFCASGRTLTTYIWEYLGNTKPDNIIVDSAPPAAPTGVRITVQ